MEFTPQESDLYKYNIINWKLNKLKEMLVHTRDDFVFGEQKDVLLSRINMAIDTYDTLTKYDMYYWNAVYKKVRNENSKKKK